MLSPALRYSKSLWSYNPLPNGCVLYLPLWHPSLQHTKFKSIDPFGHTVTVIGGVWGADGWTVDGDDYMTIPHHIALEFGTGDFSIGVEVKSSAAWSNDYIVHKKERGNEGYYLSGDAGGRFRFEVEDLDTDRGFAYSNIGNDYSDGADHQVIVTRTSLLGSLYVDGALDNTAVDFSAVDDTTTSTNETLYIGSKLGPADFYVGSLRTIWIWNYAVTAEQAAYANRFASFK